MTDYIEDQDTGELIPVDQAYDLGYELTQSLDQPQEIPQEPSWSETLFERAPTAAVVGGAKVGNALEQGLGDLLGAVGADQWSQDINQHTRENRDLIDFAEKAYKQDFRPNTWRKTAANLGEMALPMGAMALAPEASILGGMGIGAGTFGGTTFLSEYGQNRGTQDVYDAALNSIVPAAQASVQGLIPGTIGKGFKGFAAGMGAGNVLGYGINEYNLSQATDENGQPLSDRMKEMLRAENAKAMAAGALVPMLGVATKAGAKAGFGKLRGKFGRQITSEDVSAPALDDVTAPSITMRPEGDGTLALPAPEGRQGLPLPDNFQEGVQYPPYDGQPFPVQDGVVYNQDGNGEPVGLPPPRGEGHTLVGTSYEGSQTDLPPINVTQVQDPRLGLPYQERLGLPDPGTAYGPDMGYQLEGDPYYGESPKYQDLIGYKERLGLPAGQGFELKGQPYAPVEKQTGLGSQNAEFGGGPLDPTVDPRGRLPQPMKRARPVNPLEEIGIVTPEGVIGQFTEPAAKVVTEIPKSPAQVEAVKPVKEQLTPQEAPKVVNENLQEKLVQGVPGENLNPWADGVREGVAHPVLGEPKKVGFTWFNPLEAVLRPEIFQFRWGTGKGGVKASNRVEGVWDSTQAGDFKLFEPLAENRAKYGLQPNERYIVVDGHHRKQGMTERDIQDAQKGFILRESDGWNPSDAKLYAAQTNIKGGTADAYDKIRFFREASKIYGKELAIAAGGKLGLKGQEGKDIGIYASPDVYSAIFKEGLDPKVARVFTEEFPNDPKGQTYLLKKWRENSKITPDQARNEAIAYSEKVDAGRDPDAWRQAVKEVIAATREASIKTKVALKSLVKGDSEILGKFSKDVDKKGAAGELARAQMFDSAIKGWRDSDHLKRELLPKIEVRYKELMKDKEAPGGQSSLFSQLGVIGDMKGEAPHTTLLKSLGFKVTPDPEIAAKVKANKKKAYWETVKNNTDEAVTEPKLAELEKRLTGKLTEEKWSDSQSHFAGEVAGRDLGFISDKVIQPFRSNFSYLSTISHKFPQFAGVQRAAENFVKNTSRVIHKATENLSDYYDVENQSRMNMVLDKANKMGAKFPLTENFLKTVTLNKEKTARLNPDEIKGIVAFKKTMDNAWDAVGQTLINEARLRITDPAKLVEKLVAIRDSLGEMKQGNYIPKIRFGRFGVKVLDENGALVRLTLHETAKEQAAEAARLIANKQDATKFRVPKVVADSEMTTMMSAFGSKLAHLDPEFYNDLADKYKRLGVNMTGFSKHFIESHDLPGYSTDFGRSIATYMTNLSKWASKRVFNAEIDKAMEQLDPVQDTALVAHAQDYKKMVNEDSPSFGPLRKFMSLYFLNSPKSAAFNLTSTYSVAWGELSKHTDNSLAKITRGLADGASYMSNKEVWAKKNPEIAKGLQVALEDGIASVDALRELTGRARNTFNKKMSASELVMYAWDTSENLNRVSHYITAFKVAKEKGLNFDAAHRFAEDFVKTVDFDYSIADRPLLTGKMGGMGALATTFQHWTGHYQRVIRNNMTKENQGALWRQLGTMALLTGAVGFPLGKQFIRIAEGAGYDPKREIRDFIQEGDLADMIKGFGINPRKVADATIYGLPNALAGIDMSGSVGVSGPDFMGKSLPEAIGSAMLGVSAELYNRPMRAKDAWLEYDSPYRAVEALLPEWPRHAAVALRSSGAVSGELPGFRGNDRTLIAPADPYSLAVKSLGVNPAVAVRGQEAIRSSMLEKQGNENINFKIGNARATGNRQSEKEWRDYARKKGIKVNENAVETQKKHILEKQGGIVAKASKANKGKARDIWESLGF